MGNVSIVSAPSNHADRRARTRKKTGTRNNPEFVARAQQKIAGKVFHVKFGQYAEAWSPYTKIEEENMAESKHLVVFTVDDQQFALQLSSVERIVRAVEVTHLPEAPRGILGVINVEGRVIPVVNSRRRLGLPERELEPDDLFIIVNENDLNLALVADEVKPVLEIPEQQVVTSERMLPGAGMVDGVAKVEDGMIVILSIAQTLSPEDHHRVTSAIEGIG